MTNSKDKGKGLSHKEWDEARCPICMEHPHNAVQLICSSRDKGCKSFICDTSYRHSNCLDRFKKPTTTTNDDNEDNTTNNNNNIDGNNCNNNDDDDDNDNSSKKVENVNGLKCPLCRGEVEGWTVDREAREYMDWKWRACSREGCEFVGNYGELRRHARRAHPSSRPADVDPTRRRAWHRLERQREYGDILSAIRSAMPGAIVLGDYAIDTGDVPSQDRESAGPTDGPSPWWTTLFLFYIMGSPIRSPLSDRAARVSPRAQHRQRRRYLWGENLLGLQDDDDDDDDDDDNNDDVEDDDDDGGGDDVSADVIRVRRRHRDDHHDDGDGVGDGVRISRRRVDP